MDLDNLDRIIILSFLIITIIIVLMVAIYIFFLKKKSAFIIQQKKYQSDFEKELVRSQNEIKKQTLVYVGQELHDDVGQKLSVVAMVVGEMSKTCELASNQEKLSEISALIKECLQDIRDLSRNLVADDIHHFSLVENVKLEVQRLNKFKLINANLSFNYEDLDLNIKHSLLLFRMVQEAINNVLKHSKAKALDIIILKTEESIYIDLIDNGRGMNLQNAKDSGGTGLKNIENRARLINAKTEIISKENSGTHIKITYNFQYEPY